MTHLAIALTLTLASIPLTPVTGGSPGQRAQLQTMIAAVPDCLKNADGRPVPVRIEGPDSRSEINAQYDEGSRHHPRGVYINQSLFEPYRSQALRDMLPTSCSDPATLAAAADPVAMITHEFAHHFHLSGTYRDSQGRVHRNKDLINQFLAIKWRGQRRAALRDPEVRRLMREMARIEAMRPPRSAREADARQKKYCEMMHALDAKMASYGFPARMPGDGTYTTSDPDGAEYFAVAMETLIYHPEIFSRAYSPEEQRWLAANFGDCIATFPRRAPSYDSNAAAIRGGSNRGTGRDDRAGVAH